jgi:c-di-GMP-related signal transduction protein
VSRLNIYNKNKRLNNYARYGFTRFYFWFVNKPTVIALNSVQPELLAVAYRAIEPTGGV